MSLARKNRQVCREMNRMVALMTEIYYLSDNISVGRTLRKSFWGNSISRDGDRSLGGASVQNAVGSPVWYVIHLSDFETRFKHKK